VLAAAVILLSAERADAAAGDVDRGFGSNGVARAQFIHTSVGEDLVVQRDGKIVVAGFTVVPRGPQPEDATFRVAVARFRTDGTLDPTFGFKGRFSLADHFPFGDGMAIDQADRILVVGYYTETDAFVQDARELAVFRLLPSGRLDESFGTGGIAKMTRAPSTDSSQGFDIAVQPDGKIVTTGQRGECRGLVNHGCYAELIVARFLDNGHPDPAFGVAGVASFQDLVPSMDSERVGWGTSLAIAANGSIYAAGEIGRDFAVARMTSAGLPDLAWGENGLVRVDWGGYSRATSIVLQRDGKVVVAGEVGADCLFICQARGFGMIRYLTDGTMDTRFAWGGKFFGKGPAGATGVALQSNGKILVSMWNIIRRFTTAGRPDLAFGRRGIVTRPIGDGEQALAVQRDGRILAAGYAYPEVPPPGTYWWPHLSVTRLLP
jgi:uncharacterized delta-60 repeat protein